MKGVIVMDYTINREKLTQAVSYLQHLNIDLWLILTSEGSDPCLPLIPGVRTYGPGAFIIARNGKKIALCSSIDAQDIEESNLFDQVLTYTAGSGFDLLLRDTLLSFQPQTIALNYSFDEHLADGLTTGRYRWLRDVLDGFYFGEYVSSEPFLTKLRSIKSPTEVEKIQRAIDITLDIYESVFKQLKIGMSEKDVGQLFIEEMKIRNVVSGGDKQLSMPIVLKERIAHRKPGDAIIQPGDILIIDFSVDYDGYVSDIARTLYFLRRDEEQAPEHVEKAFRAAHQAITEAFNALKPGRKGYEIDQVAREYLLSQGMPEITHATGHQLGRMPHDGGTLLGPRWERYGQSPYGEIEKGHVYTIEPTILPEEGPWMLVEENVLVTAEGAVYLSKRQDELILIKST
jgi:Xaa-Pro aminopeptidase